MKWLPPFIVWVCLFISVVCKEYDVAAALGVLYLVYCKIGDNIPAPPSDEGSEG